ncbi:hypothetical protein NAEGRDRAFT_78864 [Naegleria gruberi]|uniref:Uncharacterized protein n=1 Tax=Naegleria gruberi TaxID=5762 RepID=D2V770_NAEGR|nr:uncharacterized protein NAEGRDRAFT_78864 [Naegleria gruberi]EFC47322.1 hypothetical protein NAEGRDRAFT_78864 [Naegleria gruberi]|eukprot:XP_002680066.1 hypothetical protein NAEGRDRAFT_78864 [Naegleria gruberi strain NEG-M]
MYQPEMVEDENAINNTDKTIVDYVYIGVNTEDLTGLKAFGFCEDFLKNLLNSIAKQKNLHLPTRVNYFGGRDREYWKDILEKEKAKLLEEITSLENTKKRLLEENQQTDTMTDDTVSEDSSSTILTTAVKRRKKRSKRVIKDVEDDSMRENGADSESSQISPKPSSSIISSEEITPLKKLKMDTLEYDVTPVSNTSPTNARENLDFMLLSRPNADEPIVTPTHSESSHIVVEKSNQEQVISSSPPKIPSQTSNLISQESIAEESDSEDNSTSNTRLSLVNMPKSPKVDKLKVISPLQNRKMPIERRNEEFAVPSLPSQSKRSTQESSTQKSSSTSSSLTASLPSQNILPPPTPPTSSTIEETIKQNEDKMIVDIIEKPSETTVQPLIEITIATEEVVKKDPMLDEGEEIQPLDNKKSTQEEKVETSFNSPPKDTSFTEPAIIETIEKKPPITSEQIVQAEVETIVEQVKPIESTTKTCEPIEKPKSPLRINTDLPKSPTLDSPSSTPDSLPPGDDLLFMEDLEPANHQPVPTNSSATTTITIIEAKQSSPNPTTKPSPNKPVLIMPTVDINFNTNDSADLNSPSLSTPTELPNLEEKLETKTETAPSPPPPTVQKPNISLEKTSTDKLDEDDETPQTLPSMNLDITPPAKEETTKEGNVKQADTMIDDEEVPPTPTPIKPKEKAQSPQIVIPPTVYYDPLESQGANVSDDEMEEDNNPPPMSTPPHNTSRILSYTTPKSDVILEEVEETQYSAVKIVLNPGDISPSKKKNPFMQVQDDETDDELSPRTPSQTFEIKDFSSPPINFSPILTKANLGSPPIVNKGETLDVKPKYELEPTIAVNFSLNFESEDEEEIPSSPVLASSSATKPVTSENDADKSNLSTPPLSSPPRASFASPMRSQPVLSQNSLPRHPIEKIDKQHPLKSYSRIKIKGPVLNMIFSPVGDPRLTICTKTQVSLIELTGSEWIQTELFGLENEENEEFYSSKFTPDGEMLIIASSSFEPSITMTMSILDDENPAQADGTLSYHIRFFDIDGSSIRSQLGQEKKPLLSLDDVRSPISCMEVYDSTLMVATNNGELLKYMLTSDFTSRVKVVTFQTLNGKEAINNLQFVPELKDFVIGSTNSYIGIWRMSSGKLLQKIALNPYSVIYSSVIKAVTTGANQGIFLVAIHKENVTENAQLCGLFFLNEAATRLHTYNKKDIPKLSDSSNDNVTAIGVSGNAEISPYLVTGTSKGLIIIFNCRTAQCVGILQDIEGEKVGSCCFHDKFPLFAAGGTRNVVIYYQTE